MAEATTESEPGANAIAVENPATGETIATVAALDADQVGELVAKARAAQPAWAEAGFESRAEVLLNARRWLVANAERVVGTIAAETGRPVDETQFAELSYGLSALEFWARQAPLYLADEEIESSSPVVRGRKLCVRYAPLGVVGVIGPWNYPLNNSFGDCIPALAAGNSVVLKPSEVTPLTSIVLAEMLAESGLADGVFQIATGRGETGAALVDAVDFVMFTGSVETGKKVMAQAAQTLTPISLELGGKDPMVVLADADLERAANAAVSYGLNNSGQVCISVERIYVEDAVHDEFLDRVTEKVEGLRQGPPGEPGSVDLGAIIFAPQIELIEAHVADALDKGARVLTGGERGPGTGPLLQADGARRRRPLDALHGRGDLRPDPAGDAGPRRRAGDRARQRWPLRSPGICVDARRGSWRAARPAARGGYRDGQRRAAQLRRPGAADGRLEGVRSRLAPRADGIRKYTKRQSLMITPGYAPSRDPHHLPYSAATTQAIGDSFALLATSELFDARQRATLSALCDTLIPSLEPPAEDEGDPHGFWRRAASHLAVPEGVEISLLQAGLAVAQVIELRLLLDGLADHGMAITAPQEAREAIIHDLCDQSPEALAGIATLRSIAKVLFYALPDLGTGRNPNWDAIGYPGPIGPPPDRERPLRIRRPAAAEETIEADVCVVGSGAGGGVIAAELAAAGRRVVVLEAGGYHDDRDFDGLEISAYQRMYLNGGPFPSVEGQVSIVAGSGVGGGTVINWTNCLRTFDHVRAEWAAEHGLSDLAESSFDAHLDAVFERLQVNEDCSDLNGPHQRLEQACEELGFDFRRIARNADRDRYDPASAAYMGFGDQSGSKLSTAKTYLVDAQAEGAEILAGARAARIVVEQGRAAGVEAEWSDPDGHRRRRTSDPAHGPRAGRGRRLRRDPLAGAAAALGDRRSGGRRVPAPASHRRRHRLLRRRSELDVGAAAGGALARVRRPRRRLRVPDRVGAGDHRTVQRRDPVALGVRSQAADARVVARRAADRAGSRAWPRARRDRRRRQPARPLCDRRRARPRPPEARRRAARSHPRSGRGARDRRQRPAGARLEARRRARAVHRRAQPARDPPARVRDLLRPSDGELSDGS